MTGRDVRLLSSLLLLASALLAGCTTGPDPVLSRDAVDVDAGGAWVRSFRLSDEAGVSYTVTGTSQAFSVCFLRAEEVDAWMRDGSGGFGCAREARDSATGSARLDAGEHRLGLACHDRIVACSLLVEVVRS